MTRSEKQVLENRLKEINREICRVDEKQIQKLLKEENEIEKKLGYTLSPLYK